MRTIPALIFLVACGVLQAQGFRSAFDMARTKDYYFLTAGDLMDLGVSSIHTIVKLDEEGGMGQSVDLHMIHFSNIEGTVTDHWYMYHDTLRGFDLDTVIENSHFVNGSFWQFDEGRLVRSGMEGYGTLCEHDYERGASSTIVHRYCKHDDGPSRYAEVFYHDNGLPRMVVVTQGSLFDHSTTTDTINYVYDERSHIIGVERNDGARLTTFFEGSDAEVDARRMGRQQIFMDHVPIETFMDDRTGYRPRWIVLSIYELAAFTFMYVEREGKYIQMETVELEP